MLQFSEEANAWDSWLCIVSDLTTEVLPWNFSHTDTRFSNVILRDISTFPGLIGWHMFSMGISLTVMFVSQNFAVSQLTRFPFSKFLQHKQIKLQCLINIFVKHVTAKAYLQVVQLTSCSVLKDLSHIFRSVNLLSGELQANLLVSEQLPRKKLSSKDSGRTTAVMSGSGLFTPTISPSCQDQDEWVSGNNCKHSNRCLAYP